MKPDIEIFGVQTTAYPSMYDVVKGADLPCAGQTMAEGIAVKEPGQITRRIVAELVKDIFLVREDEIEHAIASLLEIEKTVVEGAGAAAFAAVLANPGVFAGRKVGVDSLRRQYRHAAAVDRDPARAGARRPRILGRTSRSRTGPACSPVSPP